MTVVKVSVENMEGTIKVLSDMDKSRGLEENIKLACNIFEKPETSAAYGLKLISSNDGRIINAFISEDNFNDIRDGYFLKLVYSLSHYVKRIFDHLDDCYKEQSIEDLYNLSLDPEFIRELVKTDRHIKLLDHFTYTENLGRKELTACLICIVHLFQKKYIDEISLDFLDKVLSVLKCVDSELEQIKYALSILHKILCLREFTFNKWKIEIINKLPLTELTPYIWSEESEDIQCGALLLINTIIKSCKDEKRKQLIKEINLNQNKESIYKHIIQKSNISKNISHELYVYQTYLLSVHADALNSQVSIIDLSTPLRNEFELSDEKIKKLSQFIDYEDDNVSIRNKAISEDDLFNTEDHMTRISLMSMASSKQSDDTLDSNRFFNNANEDDHTKISLLTIEALRHYKRSVRNNFKQSQIEEKLYAPGILETSENIMRMLAKLLHIGVEPDRNSVCYQPAIFNAAQGKVFLLELFCRTMWLLSKTRKEMKASTLNDYPKVINVLEKQVKLILEQKPRDLKDLTQKIMDISYETVMQHWNEQREIETSNLIATNPCIQPIKSAYTLANQELVFEQRIVFVQKKTKFHKFNEKKACGTFIAHLSENRNWLLIEESNVKNQKVSNVESYSINDITHVAEGKACPLVKNNLVKDTRLAFSLIIKNNEYINFKAFDMKTAAYWKDAFYLLLDSKNMHLSHYYQKELDELVRMDLMLHLVELQNITIPKKPPPIPASPLVVKPPIPAKPVFKRK